MFLGPETARNALGSRGRVFWKIKTVWYSIQRKRYIIETELNNEIYDDGIFRLLPLGGGARRRSQQYAGSRGSSKYQPEPGSRRLQRLQPACWRRPSGMLLKTGVPSPNARKICGHAPAHLKLPENPTRSG